MRLLVSVNSVPHYFEARFRALEGISENFTILSSANEGDFPEFISQRRSSSKVCRLFEDRSAYGRARAAGKLPSKVYAALDDFNPDVMAVAGWAFPESLAAIHWARLRGRGVVMMSESTVNDGPRKVWKEKIKGRIVTMSQAALVGGSEHAAYMMQLGMPKERIFTGYDVVDNVHFSRGAEISRANAKEFREEYGLPRRYLLASARFIPKKNLPALIAAYAAATRGHIAPPHLVILGGGREQVVVEEAIASHNVGDRVHLPGFRQYSELPIYYGLADGFVHVSLTEQWGLVLNEAMASGLPVIVSRTCGSAPELVHEGVNGFLVDPSRVENIASAIANLIGMTHEARERMGAASGSIIAKWAPERFASGLMSAATAACGAPLRRWAPLDRMLLRTLSRQSITGVE